MWLYHNGDFVGAGFRTGEQEQRQTIHGFAVHEEEIILQLETRRELPTHPSYGYPLEAGGFTTWPRANVARARASDHSVLCVRMGDLIVEEALKQVNEELRNLVQQIEKVRGEKKLYVAAGSGVPVEGTGMQICG